MVDRHICNFDFDKISLPPAYSHHTSYHFYPAIHQVRVTYGLSLPLSPRSLTIHHLLHCCGCLTHPLVNATVRPSQLDDDDTHMPSQHDDDDNHTTTTTATSHNADNDHSQQLATTHDNDNGSHTAMSTLPLAMRTPPTTAMSLMTVTPPHQP